MFNIFKKKAAPVVEVPVRKAKVIGYRVHLVDLLAVTDRHDGKIIYECRTLEAAEKHKKEMCANHRYIFKELEYIYK